MKKFFKFSLVAALMLGAFAACETDKPEPQKAELKLSADKESISANGIDKVTFTVTSNDSEISDAVISYDATELDGNTFTSTVPGTYKFTATYEGQTSNAITVTVSEGPAHELVLSVNPEEIYADGDAKATFSVTFDGAAVEGTVISKVGGEALPAPEFTTTEVGRHEFQTSYTFEGMTYMSNKAIVTATETPSLVITSNRYSILNNGSDVATLTVMLGEQDITADADIFMNDTPFTGNSFSSTTLAEYQFYATYTHSIWGQKTSEPITIRVVDIAFDSTLPIKKSVAFFTWTATWCGPCYMFKGYLKNMATEFGDNMAILNLYTDGQDDIGSPLSICSTANQLAQEGRFSVGGYPTSIADLRDDFGTPGYVPTEAQARAAYNKYISNSPKTAVMVNSVIENGKINVNVTVGSKEVGNYNIGIFLVEDHVIAYQNGGGNNYDHTNVAREIGVGNLFGDSIGAMGIGDVYQKECSFDVLDKYNTENLSIFIYTLYEDENGDMIIDNTVKVPANDLTGFNYAN